VRGERGKIGISSRASGQDGEVVLRAFAVCGPDAGKAARDWFRLSIIISVSRNKGTNMALFDDVVAQVDQKLGLHDQVQKFLSLLLAQVLDPKSGGISGLISRLKSAGMGSVADRVLAGRDRAPLSAREIEIALGGKDALQSLASKAGLPEATAAGAAGFLLPRVFHALAPAGRVPEKASNEVLEYIKAHTQRLIGTGPAEPISQPGSIDSPQPATVVRTVIESAPPVRQAEPVHHQPAQRPAVHSEEPVRAQEPAYREPARGYDAPRREVVRERYPALPVPAPIDESSWLWWALPALGLAMLGLYSIKACAPTDTYVEPGSYARPPAVVDEPDDLPFENQQIPVRTRDAEPRLDPAQTRELETRPAPAPQPLTTPTAPTQPAATPVQPAQAATPAVLPVPAVPVDAPPVAVNTRLHAERLDNGHVRVTGVVPNEEIRKQLSADVIAAYGDKATLQLTIDPNAATPAWIGKVVDVLKLLGNQPKSALTFDGGRFAIGGTLTDAEKARLLEAVKALFGAAFEIQ